MIAKSKKSSHSNLRLLIWILPAFRILLVLVPQLGYIHPDEYFQSMEVLAGRIFDVSYSPPWEFETTRPIRGVTIPFFTTGLSYIFLRDINALAMKYLSINVLTPYFLLIIPRLIMTLLSLVVDYSLVRICLNNNEKYLARLLVLGSSYIIIVYATRTFSNSIELILFALLLYFVCESLTFSNELKRKQVYINYRYEKSKNIIEKVKFYKLKFYYLASDHYTNSFAISTITVMGVFNRPTFMGFAAMPLFFWINRGVDGKNVSIIQFHSRIICLIFCSIPAIIFNVVIDSFYYGSLTWGEIGMIEISINNFVMTPFNFIRYNSNASNLEEHGLHPRFLHLLINIPLLFNVLGMLALYDIAKYTYWCFCGKLQLLPSIKSIKMLMILSFITPLVMLSTFPHQEPRFLIPLIFPLVYLHGDSLLPNYCSSLEAVTTIEEQTNNISKKICSINLFKIWLILNVFLVGFYGFLHQGGIFSIVKYLHDNIQSAPSNTEFHIVTSNMYTLPKSFLLQRENYTLSPKHTPKKHVFLYEEGSRDVHLIMHQLKDLLEMRRKANKLKVYKFYFITLDNHKKEIENVFPYNGILFNKIVSFWPHFSTEAIPDLTRYCFFPVSMFYQDCEVISLSDYGQRTFEMFQLTMYQISLSP